MEKKRKKKSLDGIPMVMMNKNGRNLSPMKLEGRRERERTREKGEKIKG